MPKKYTSIFIFIFIFLLCSHCDTKSNDLYTDKLVYLKWDKSLFTGTLRINDWPHTAIYSFCNGMPCGDWEYRFKGDLIQKGTFVHKSYFSDSFLRLMKQDTFVINYFQEGELQPNEHPQYLSLEIIGPPSFFKSDYSKEREYFDRIANALSKEKLPFKYDYIWLGFLHHFYAGADDDLHENIEVEYKMKDSEPVFVRVRQ